MNLFPSSAKLKIGRGSIQNKEHEKVEINMLGFYILMIRKIFVATHFSRFRDLEFLNPPKCPVKLNNYKQRLFPRPSNGYVIDSFPNLLLATCSTHSRPMLIIIVIVLGRHRPDCNVAMRVVCDGTWVGEM